MCYLPTVLLNHCTVVLNILAFKLHDMSQPLYAVQYFINKLVWKKTTTVETILLLDSHCWHFSMKAEALAL